MSGKKRIHAEERRQKIIDAAKPLFANFGFNGTSIRDIARAADVSNALLYKHFPSKEAMYEEIINYTDWLSSKILRNMKELEASTETLVLIFYVTIRLILFEVPGSGRSQKEHERLLFYSLLENLNYAQKSLNRLYSDFEEIIRENFRAAERSGDCIEISINRKSRFWFVHHLAMGLNLCHISGEPAFDYDTSFENLMEDSVFFALRGIGLSDKALKKYYKPEDRKKKMKLIV